MINLMSFILLEFRHFMIGLLVGSIAIVIAVLISGALAKRNKE